QLGEAGRQVNEFFWSDYCDWYVEIAKVQMQGDEEARRATAGILRAVLDQSLRLLHPYMPFVTEELWQYLYHSSEPDQERWPAPALIVAPWPQANSQAIDVEAEQAISQLAGPVEIYLPLAGMIDTGKELERLDKEIAQARQEIIRLQGKLANESFVTRAKPEVVEKEREKLAAQEERIEKLEARRVE